MSVRIIEGDCRSALEGLPAESVDCVVTSPPYWGLRDYGVAGQLGMERTLGEHLDVMIDVFERVRRVMKPAASLWLNYGDCYATTPNGRSAAATKAAGGDDRTFRDKPFSTVGPIFDPAYEKTKRGSGKNLGQVMNDHGGRIVAGGRLKPKDLCMVGNRLAIALQEAGWWVRSEIIWGKPNGMPDSSGRYRPSVAFEKIFLLGKSGDIYYDFEAVKKPVAASSVARYAQDIDGQAGSSRANGGGKTNGTMKAVGGPRSRAVDPRYNGHINHQFLDDLGRGEGRLLRNFEPVVWEIPIAGFSQAHFATFPPELARRCILAGCQPGGLVLDPFGGAGTVGLVADRLGRDCILIELNPDYCAMADARLRAARRQVEGPPRTPAAAGPLFEEAAE